MAFTKRVGFEREESFTSVPGNGDLLTDAWGTQKVSTPYSLFHGVWTFSIPSSMWFMYENGTQVYSSTNVISNNSVAQLTADVTNTTVLLESRECPRYQPNRGHLFSTSGWFPNKTNNGVRDFGLFTAEHGVFFRLKSDGKLYAVLRRNSTEVLEEEIDTSSLSNFDVEKNNVYDIQFQWRSAGNYKFFIGDPGTGASKLVHTFNLLGTLTSPSLGNPALPISFKATRTTEDVEMNIGCADVTSENGNGEAHQYESAFAEGVSVSSTDSPVLTLYSPLQAAGETNTRTVHLARITMTCDKKATFKVWVTRDGAAITGATLATINNNGGTLMQSDSPDSSTGAVRATSVTPASMSVITAAPVQANDRTPIENPLERRIVFPVVRGDYLVVTCSPSGTATAECVIEWGEQI